jgi:hypothetical protein|tara:strand:- start:1930 stop:2235 length:306 start_codon:yes stop_codon:yes gene_type:complete
MSDIFVSLPRAYAELTSAMLEAFFAAPAPSDLGGEWIDARKNSIIHFLQLSSFANIAITAQFHFQTLARPTFSLDVLHTLPLFSSKCQWLTFSTSMYVSES